MTPKNTYFAHPAISRSALMDFREAPAIYKYHKDHPGERKDTKATLTGSAEHYLLFEPGKIKDYMVVLNEAERPAPDKNYLNKENQTWRANFHANADAKGLQVISSDEYGVAEDMYAAIEKNPRAMELLRAPGAVYEEMITWKVGDLEFKAKPDVDHPEFMVDFKTAENGHPLYFARKIFDLGYGYQGGMYSDGARKKENSVFFKPYFIVVQEKTPPYPVSVHLLSDEVLAYYADLYLADALALDKCRRDNVWPGYEYWYKDVNNIFLPSYLKK